MYKNLYMYVIMKTICPSGYYHNSFVATHAPGLQHLRLYVAGTNKARVLKKQNKKRNISGHK